MKATGIIRRIDELGRIVIPKEIRKNLRIREGDNLEIFINDYGNIVLRKYSMLKNINDYAKSVCEAMFEIFKKDIIITDNDIVIACSGGRKKEFLKKNISDEIQMKILRRETLLEKYKKDITIVNDVIETSYAIVPIVVNGDCAGTIIVLGDSVTELEYNALKVGSRLIENMLNEV